MQDHRDVFCCWPGRETVLVKELLRQGASAEVVAEGWVVATTPLPFELLPSLAFASQVWPHAAEIEAKSIKAWAEAIVAALRDGIDDEPWRLHVHCQDVAGSQVTARRAALIEEAVRTLLKQKQRRLLRTLLGQEDMAKRWQTGETLAEVALVGREHGFVSVVRAPERKRWRHVLSRFPGGLARPEEDKAPPARAYLKLREALMHMGRAPKAGETLVDLGASPGSWTYDALMAGVYVTGIDRSPLRDDLMAHDNFTFAKADAFKFAPDAPVDWLVCDVIAFPQRNIALLDQWLGEGWCKHFVVTLKFKGADDYPVVDMCKEMLRRHRVGFGLRQLQNNKNEVTAYGTARG